MSAESTPAEVEYRNRLQLDRQNHSALQGDIKEVRLGLSDPHRGGRQVAETRFDDGSSWFYKPRSLWPERLFLEVYDAVCPGTHEPLYSLIDRGDYGWMSGVAPVKNESPSEGTEYWRRTGAVMAALHVLGVTDIHTENLIDNGLCLVPVDLECLAQPVLAGSVDALGDGPVAIGILPRSMAWYTDIARDMSGLHCANLPSGIPRPRSQAILDGYREAITLAGSFDPDAAMFDAIEHEPVRVLARQTGLYLPFLGCKPSDWINAAPPLNAVVADVLGTAGVARLLDVEASSLAVGDVPLIAAVEDGLVALTESSSVELGRGVARSPRAGVTRRIELAGRPAAVHAWCDDIRIRLAHGAWSVPAQPRGPSPLVNAVETANALAGRAVQTGSEQVSWPSECIGGFSGSEELRIGVPGLFDGDAGIALVLGMAARVTNDEQLAGIALQALPASSSVATGLGFDTGGAGIVWATAWVGALLERDDLLARAADWCLESVPTTCQDDRLDLVDGWSGIMLAAALVGRLTGSADVMGRAHDLARSCGEATRTDTTVVPCLARTGMARGSTGVVMALLLASAEFHDAELLADGRRLFDREERCVAEQAGISGRVLVGREAGVPMRSWFQGTAGYLIARDRTSDQMEPDIAHTQASRSHLLAAEMVDASLTYGQLGVDVALGRRSETELPRALGLARGQAGAVWRALAASSSDNNAPNPLTIL